MSQILFAVVIAFTNAEHTFLLSIKPTHLTKTKLFIKKQFSFIKTFVRKGECYLI